MLNANESDERGGVKSEEDNTDAADVVYVDGQRLNVPRMIALIKNLPVLYDKAHRHFHNEARKDQAWESVAGDLQIDGSFGSRLFDVTVLINVLGSTQRPR